MIRQDDGRIQSDDINNFGCYYMCLIYMANVHTNISVSPDFIEHGLYIHAIRKGWVVTNSEYRVYVTDAPALLDWLGLPCEIVIENGTHRLPPDRVCGDDEFEILFFKRPGKHGHFVAGDGKGNVGYDPLGKSLSVADGKLVNKRVFRRTSWG